MIRGLLVTAVLALAVALFAWSSLRNAGALCEVCVDSSSGSHCAKVQGNSESAAREAAQRSACGVVSRGMAAELACMQRPPRSAQCSAAR